MHTNKGGHVVTSISLQELRDAVVAGTVTVVETLREEHYADGHLPGAVHLHFDDVPAHARELVPDLSTPIVTYCSNGACRNSEIAAERLVELGYRNVRRYVDGKQDWVAHGLPLEQTEVAAR
jgi:rhodanese-related sulfurtransferase